MLLLYTFTFDTPKNHMISETYQHSFRQSSNYIFWQAICSRNPVKFGVNFRAYHQFNRDSDYLNIWPPWHHTEI